MNLNFKSTPYRSYGALRRSVSINFLGYIGMVLISLACQGVLQRRINTLQIATLAKGKWDSQADFDELAVCNSELQKLNEMHRHEVSRRLSIEGPRRALIALSNAIPATILLKSVRIHGLDVEIYGQAFDEEALVKIISKDFFGGTFASSRLKSTHDVAASGGGGKDFIFIAELSPSTQFSRAITDGNEERGLILKEQEL